MYSNEMETCEKRTKESNAKLYYLIEFDNVNQVTRELWIIVWVICMY